MPITLTAAADDDGRRLDRILRKALPALPLSAIHRLLRKGGVLVDGKPAFANYRVKAGQTITINSKNLSQSHRDTEENKKNSFSSVPQCLSVSVREFADIILFEGAGLLVLNKPAGLAVHGKGSLEDLVLSYLKPKLPPSLSFRPGPLHRLDRPSSGVIAFSTSLEGARFFSAMMRDRMIKKQYLALVNGVIEKAEIWEDCLVRDELRKKTFRGRSGVANGVYASKPSGVKCGEARTALTRVNPLVGDVERTLILAEIETGRTHQIRAQAAIRGHPLSGDKKYGGLVIKNNVVKDDVIKDGVLNSSAIYGDATYDEGFLLHAWRMEFPGKTGGDLIYDHDKCLQGRIEAPIPKNFLDKIRNFFGEGIINNRLSNL